MDILSYNLLRDATITESSEGTYNPVENLYSRRKFETFKFTGYTSEWVKFYDLGGIAFNTIIIDYHNLTAGATVKVQANDTDVWTSPSVDVTLSISDVMTNIWSSTQTYNYVRVTFEDSGNTEAIYVGTIFLALSHTFTIRPGFGINHNIGQVEYRDFNGAFPLISATQRGYLKTILDRHSGTIFLSLTRQQFGSAWPLYVIVDPNGLSSIDPIYCILIDGFSLIRKRTSTEYWDGSFTFEEVF